MLRVGIAFFSGTGNTWRIAEQYAEAFRWHGHHAELLPIEDLVRVKQGAWFVNYDLIGLAYPVHCWNAPRLVLAFLDTLPYDLDKRVFVALTAGGNIGGAMDYVKRRLSHFGYQVVHAAHYYTGSYYGDRAFREQTDEELLRRTQWVDGETWEAVAELLERHDRDYCATDTARVLLSGLLWRLYLAACRQAPRWLYATAACDGCGLCARSCPTDNIAVTEGPEVAFSARCTLCLRCVGICPQAAIQLTSRTEGFGRYLAPGFRGHLRSRFSGRGRDPSRH